MTTHQEKIEFLKSNGWITHWGQDNWVKSTERINDKSGYCTNDAYTIATREANAIVKYNNLVRNMNQHRDVDNRWPEFEDLRPSSKWQVIEQFTG